MDVVAPGVARSVLMRLRYHPETWLTVDTCILIPGLAFNWGIPVAWISVTGAMPPPAIWVLFLGGVWYALSPSVSARWLA